MPTYVALDLETTGLTPAEDAIIEVGALRFSAEGIIDQFATLVSPGRSVPYRIRLLTGIDDDLLADAPAWPEVARALAEFLGELPVVGQNVGFDLAFLAQGGLRPRGPIYDTQELAQLLLPGLPDYSLRALGRHLGVENPRPHRALADAEAAMGVFLALRERAATLPPQLLAEVGRLGEQAPWPGAAFFQALAQEALTGAQRGQPLGGVPLAGRGASPSPTKGLPEERPLSRRHPPEPIDPAQAAALILGAKEHPKLLPGFEERPQQLAMAGAVAEALNEGHHLLVEAGTGVGKSLAYLAPAALYALHNGARIVISTDTISLQEQLANKDLPALKGLLAAQGQPGELRGVHLKGRRNYLCRRRFEEARRNGPQSVEEAKLLARLILWQWQSPNGDRGELNLYEAQEPLWTRLSAQQEDCLAGPCPFVADGSCYLLRARRRAEAAHLVIVNHALLLSDLAVGGHLIPAYDHLIIDEAHNLEEEATRQLGLEVRDGDVAAHLDGLHRPGMRGGGLVAALRAWGRAQPLSSALGQAEALAEAAEGARRRAEEFWNAVARFLAQSFRGRTEGEGDYDRRLLLTPALRAQPAFKGVETAWENLDLALARPQGELERLALALADEPEAEELLAQVSSYLGASRELRQGMASVVGSYDPARICWLLTYQRGPSGPGLGLAAAPLAVGPILEKALWGVKAAAVLTSATLAVGDSFAYLKERLGLESAASAGRGRELRLDSPFDYRRSTLLLVPRDMPDPDAATYPRALAEAVVGLLGATGGRALLLFTSHAALRGVYEAAREPLGQQGVRLLAQGIDGSPPRLLEALRREPRTALLGTASFWEGVDVIGSALSLLLVAKLPFAVPTEPIFAARASLLPNPFQDYALPQAVLRFRQGFGRLIRHRQDRGVMVVLDRRVRSRSYGRAFLEALPPCTLREAPLAQLPTLAAAWLEDHP